MTLLAEIRKPDGRFASAWRFGKPILPRGEWILLTLAVATALAGQIVGLSSGRSTDFHVVTTVVEDLSLLGILTLSAFLAGLLLDAAKKKSKSPTRHVLAALSGFFYDPARFGRALRTVAIFTLFAIGFGELKGLAALGGFQWDEPLMHAERWLHFGFLPHEWLSPFYDWPRAVQLVNYIYNLWYFVMIGMVLLLALRHGSPSKRFRYLCSFMATWLIGGVVMALIFSSAGPCFYGRLGFGAEYAPLMAELGAIDKVHELYALSTQDMLWESFAAGKNAAAISAFPSLHVATATLVALFAWTSGKMLRIAGLLFLGAIMLGSVLLGWHYALDGYAGIALALIAWTVTGRLAQLAGVPATASTSCLKASDR
ncbi:phosphatase PAP2 family protein [Notoacmeibacter ruber]|uniref:Inositol phosphorylceramide synthase n=1 Tax=Notoacmeibacter ruber TaxID=2670375 RepID=A0A3L7J8H1_9HYPH|nr:phosphatase PAP2 family protein [Notoacmeibacter ruber]RLQ86963.1 inositol phosphorylceramide synthase [Notoacmeibacter ruber]